MNELWFGFRCLYTYVLFLLPRFLLLRSMFWSEPFLPVLCCGIFLRLHIFFLNKVAVGMHTLAALRTPCVTFCKDSWTYSPSIFFFQPANIYFYGLRWIQTPLGTIYQVALPVAGICWTSNLLYAWIRVHMDCINNYLRVYGFYNSMILLL